MAQIDTQFIRARPFKLWPRLLAYTLFEGRPLTTRGRWINPLVFSGFKLWATLPAGRRGSDPIFILGVGRSGTTILGSILALHKDLGFLNEPKALWHAALGNDDLIGSYSRQPGRYRLSGDDAGPAGLRRLRRFHAAYLAVAGCKRVVDKYPELLFRPDLIRSAFPDARRILLVRNGLDVCRSIERWSATHGSTDIGWWGKNDRKWNLLVEELVVPDRFFASVLDEIRRIRRHVDRAAIEWIVTMREGLRQRDEGGQDILFLRYEDLLRNPTEALETISKYCNLEQDERMISYARTVLRAGRPKPPTDIHPALRPLLDATMQRLGYTAGPDE